MKHTKLKKWAAVLLCLTLCLACLPSTALAVSEHITISTADELMEFATTINSKTYAPEDTADILVELTADIDMTGYN